MSAANDTRHELTALVWRSTDNEHTPTTVSVSIVRASGIHDDTAARLEASLSATPLERERNGMWATTRKLQYGSYHFLFQVDGRWLVSDQHGHTLLANGKEVNYVEVPKRQKITFTPEMFDDVVPLLGTVKSKRKTCCDDCCAGGCCSCCTIS